MAAAEFRRVPLTLSLCALCVVLTASSWGELNVRFLLEDPLRSTLEPWRFVTSTFFHVDFIHLFFNVAWLWLLGSALEQDIGRLRLLALMIASAFTSSAWQLALVEEGVGASGCVYALYAFAWLLRNRPALVGVVSPQRTLLMVGWFFICIVATARGDWNVGNVAHGVGAMTGALLGVAARWEGARRIGATITLTVAVLGGYIGAALRPTVGVWANGTTEARIGYELFTDGRTQESIPYLEQAARYRNAHPSFKYTLGLGYVRAGRPAEAVTVLRPLVAAAPDATDVSELLADALRRVAVESPPKEAIVLLEEAVRVAPKDSSVWFALAKAYGDAGRNEDFYRAAQRASALAPPEPPGEL
jgi:GlpG protein